MYSPAEQGVHSRLVTRGATSASLPFLMTAFVCTPQLKRRNPMSATVKRSLPLNVLTGARMTIAVLAVLAPRVAARIFRMDVEGTPAVAMGRMFGIRNAALAVGLLRLDHM